MLHSSLLAHPAASLKQVVKKRKINLMVVGVLTDKKKLGITGGSMQLGRDGRTDLFGPPVLSCHIDVSSLSLHL